MLRPGESWREAGPLTELFDQVARYQAFFAFNSQTCAITPGDAVRGYNVTVGSKSAREHLAGLQELKLFQTEVVIRAHCTQPSTEKEAVQYDPLMLLPRRRHAEPYVDEALRDVHT